MKYDIKPKPTTYNGVEFRSRLESKWASFFDLVGWDWTYEPGEVNGYNPDFFIRCNSMSYPTNTIIVEVKPSLFLTKDEKNSILNKYKNEKAHILILTDMPFYAANFCGNGPAIGIGSQYSPDIDASEWLHTELYDLEMKSLNDIGSSYMSYDGMIYGEVERKCFIDLGSSEEDVLNLTWKEAGNIVKFFITQ